MLPVDLPASVAVALHLAPSITSPTALLSKHTSWPVQLGQDGARLSVGQIYVAPANHHLALERDVMRVFRGPRENGSRPAIDVLFRSAAVHHRAEVIGVLLSGALSDGSLGLAAIKRCGGAALVQEPSDATNAEMPRRALSATQVDHCVPAAQMAGLLTELIRRPTGESPAVPEDLRLEAQLASRAADPRYTIEQVGSPLPLSCPECSGPLSYLSGAHLSGTGARVYRCHVGHSYDPESLLAEHSLALERALWVAFRTIKERGVLLAQMARDARDRGYASTASGFEDHLRELEAHAASVREAMAVVSEPRPREETPDGD